MSDGWGCGSFGYTISYVSTEKDTSWEKATVAPSSICDTPVTATSQYVPG